MRPAPEPSIAVVVPNRNDSRYLSRCLTSVIRQRVPADELVVVDDQSTDDSAALARALIADHPRARLIENPVNLGVDGAMREGMRHVTSDYVLFLASNDFLLPGIFERAKRCLARAPGIGLWSAMAWFVDEADRPLRLHPSPVVSLSDAVLPPERCVELARRVGNWFTGTSLIYSRAAIEEAGYFNASLMGLSDLVTALVVSSRHGAAYSPAPLCAIRVHGGSHLERTLSDPERLEKIATLIADHGGASSPKLFTPAFAERTRGRLRFASVRSTRGASLEAVAALSGGAVQAVARMVPARFARLRIALAFALLRPFDIVPTLWHRLLGWAFVRLSHRWPGPP